MVYIVGFILIAVASIVGLIILRKPWNLQDDFFRQTVSGVLIALLSFGATFTISRYERGQDREERKATEIIEAQEKQKVFFIKLHNEISENRLTLETEIRDAKHIITLPLRTDAWEAGKYGLPLETPRLQQALKYLYIQIEKYNWQVNYTRHKVFEERLTPSKIPDDAWVRQKDMMNNLYVRLKEFEKLMAREAVLINELSKAEYEKDFGAWETCPSTPYFEKTVVVEVEKASQPEGSIS